MASVAASACARLPTVSTASRPLSIAAPACPFASLVSVFAVVQERIDDRAISKSTATAAMAIQRRVEVTSLAP